MGGETTGSGGLVTGRDSFRGPRFSSPAHSGGTYHRKQRKSKSVDASGGMSPCGEGGLGRRLASWQTAPGRAWGAVWSSRSGNFRMPVCHSSGTHGRNSAGGSDAMLCEWLRLTGLDGLEKRTSAAFWMTKYDVRRAGHAACDMILPWEATLSGGMSWRSMCRRRGAERNGPLAEDNG